MKIKMLMTTNYKGAFFEANSVHEMDEITAKRWQKNGLAKVQVSKKVEKVEVEAKEKKSDKAIPTAKELFVQCKELGIDIKPKLKAEEYVEAIAKFNKTKEDGRE